MLTLAFQGWWQCRFATDPDPTDDPRGVSGPTFTVAGEPDFDRVIRLQDPVAPRYPHETDIGVTVTGATIDAQPLGDHPLLGARVDLLGGPEFMQRNLIYVDAPFVVLIDPFQLELSGGGVTLRRAALWDITRPKLRFDDVFEDPALVTPRTNAIEIQSPIVAEATGVMDYAATPRGDSPTYERSCATRRRARLGPHCANGWRRSRPISISRARGSRPSSSWGCAPATRSRSMASRTCSIAITGSEAGWAARRSGRLPSGWAATTSTRCAATCPGR